MNQYDSKDLEYALALLPEGEEREQMLDQYMEASINERVRKQLARKIPSLLWLASCIDMKPITFLSVVSRLHAGEELCSVYYRKKRSGNGYRKIVAPHEELKNVQKWVASELLSSQRSPPLLRVSRRPPIRSTLTSCKEPLFADGRFQGRVSFDISKMDIRAVP